MSQSWGGNRTHSTIKGKKCIILSKAFHAGETERQQSYMGMQGIVKKEKKERN